MVTFRLRQPGKRGSISFFRYDQNRPDDIVNDWINLELGLERIRNCQLSPAAVKTWYYAIVSLWLEQSVTNCGTRHPWTKQWHNLLTALHQVTEQCRKEKHVDKMIGKSYWYFSSFPSIDYLAFWRHNLRRVPDSEWNPANLWILFPKRNPGSSSQHGFSELRPL